MQTNTRTGSGRQLAIALVVIAILFFAAAIFFATQETSLLASGTGIHYKHALLAAGLGVLSLIGANVARRR